MFQKQTLLMGLDINTSGLTWVQIYQVKHQVAHVKNYGRVDFLENNLAFPEVLELPTLKVLLEKSRIGIALKDDAFQSMEIPVSANCSTLEIKRQFKAAAMSLFNQPIKNLCFRHHLLGFTKDNPTELNFLLVVTERKLIEQWLGYFQTYHLKLRLIDVESFALARGKTFVKNRAFTLDHTLNKQDFSNQHTEFQLCLGLTVHSELNKYDRP
jgi:Tfp pilus assembly PilM family ATPase